VIRQRTGRSIGFPDTTPNPSDRDLHPADDAPKAFRLPPEPAPRRRVGRDPHSPRRAPRRAHHAGRDGIVGRRGVDAKTGTVTFTDCSPESPAGRRSLCYDRAALDARKEAKPAGSAVEAAAAMGAELLTEAQYRALQTLGAFDLKTSSWIATPTEIRALGGALFCDRRYGQVFTYHNGVQSYYAARGFRVQIRV